MADKVYERFQIKIALEEAKRRFIKTVTGRIFLTRRNVSLSD